MSSLVAITAELVAAKRARDRLLDGHPDLLGALTTARALLGPDAMRALNAYCAVETRLERVRDAQRRVPCGAPEA